MDRSSQEWRSTGAHSPTLGVGPPKWASFSASLLATELETVFGPVIYVAEESIWEDKLQDLTPRPYSKCKEEPLADAGYTDRSNHHPIPQWAIVPANPSTELWFETKTVMSSQWAELQTV